MNLNRRCATCKHFFQGAPYSECHRYPPQTSVLLVGIGPRTPQNPHGQPIIHKDVCFPVTMLGEVLLPH
jgi:hypothetical protein